MVKWFRIAKKIGFFSRRAAAGEGVVHISAVEKAGLSGLNEGRLNSMKSRTREKLRHKI